MTSRAYQQMASDLQGPVVAESPPCEDQATHEKKKSRGRLDFAIAALPATCLQGAWVFAAWILVLQPSLASKLPGIRLFKLLQMLNWQAFIAPVTKCLEYMFIFLDNPADVALAIIPVSATQLKALETELGLDSSSMALMLLVANITVILVYMASAVYVISMVLPAIWNVVSSTSKLAIDIAKTFKKFLKDPRSVLAIHTVLYAACFYILAAGTTIASTAPSAGANLALLAHILVCTLAHANAIALRARPSAQPSSHLALSTAYLYVLLAASVASSAVHHQSALAGFITVAAIHLATAQIKSPLLFESAAALQVAIITSTALFAFVVGCRRLGVAAPWYAPFTLGVATISKHSLFVVSLHHTAVGEGKRKVTNNVIFLLECIVIALASQVLSMVDLYNSVWMYVVAWAAWKLSKEAPDRVKYVAALMSGVVVCNACYFLLTHPTWFKSMIAL